MAIRAQKLSQQRDDEKMSGKCNFVACQFGTANDLLETFHYQYKQFFF